MPRRCKVEVQEAIAAILKTNEIFNNGELPNYTNSFYKEVSINLNDIWTAHDVYIY